MLHRLCPIFSSRESCSNSHLFSCRVVRQHIGKLPAFLSPSPFPKDLQTLCNNRTVMMRSQEVTAGYPLTTFISNHQGIKLPGQRIRVMCGIHESQKSSSAQGLQT